MSREVLGGWIGAPCGVQTRLADEMRAQSINGVELEEISGVHRNLIYSYLRGERVPNGATLLKVAAGLDCSVDHLWRLEGES